MASFEEWHAKNFPTCDRCKELRRDTWNEAIANGPGYDLGLANGLRLAGVKLGKTHLIVNGKLKRVRKRGKR